MLNRLIQEDTIAAISTPMGTGGISIVRISGRDALKIGEKIFNAKNGKKLATLKSHRVIFGDIIDVNNKIIDEVIVTVMRKPNTYTKEDIVEINCHGGVIVTKEILSLVIEFGARVAEPGEFTMRAFLNGRIDLVQAEAILDIIEAKTKNALELSLRNLEGGLSKKINTLSKDTVDILSFLEAQINFPEESDVQVKQDRGILEKINIIKDKLSSLIKASDQAKIIKEGVNAVICGKANVGKSSLLNALLEKKRSIVSHIPGTTRDTVEESINLDGILLRITDTAGIKNPKNAIEKEAILRTKKAIKNADIIFFVVANNDVVSREEINFIKKLKNKRLILVVNKADLPKKINISSLNMSNHVLVSALKRKNLDKLKKLTVDLVLSDKIDSNEEVILTSVRQVEALKKSQQFLENAIKSIKENLSFEFIAEDIKNALNDLDSITGKVSSDGILENIFSKFCIGK